MNEWIEKDFEKDAIWVNYIYFILGILRCEKIEKNTFFMVESERYFSQN